MKRARERVVMADIAQACGVSKASVSLALSGSVQISETLRERILAKADELGYRRDPALGSLNAYRWGGKRHHSVNLGYLYCGGEQARSANLCIEPALELAKTLGYAMEAFDTLDFTDGAHLARVLEARGIGGLVFGPWREPDYLRKFPWKRFTSLNLNVGEWNPPVHTVAYDAFRDTAIALEHLRRAGAQKVGLALVVDARPTPSDEFSFAAARHANEPLRPDCRVATRVQQFARASWTDELLTWVCEEALDGIIVPDEGFAEVLEAGGYRIPDRLKVIVAALSSEKSGWSGFQRPREQICMRGLHWLDRMIRRNECGLPQRPELLFVPSAWVPGNSIGPPSTNDNG